MTSLAQINAVFQVESYLQELLDTAFAILQFAHIKQHGQVLFRPDTPKRPIKIKLLKRLKRMRKNLPIQALGSRTGTSRSWHPPRPSSHAPLEKTKMRLGLISVVLTGFRIGCAKMGAVLDLVGGAKVNDTRTWLNKNRSMSLLTYTINTLNNVVHFRQRVRQWGVEDQNRSSLFLH